VHGSRPAPTPRSGKGPHRSPAAARAGPPATLPDPSLSYGHVKATNENVGCCAPGAAPGTARPGPVRFLATKYKWTVHELIATINLIHRLHDIVREVLQVGDDILTFDRHMIDISQIGEWQKRD
jgi:hypothetical protein